MPVYANGKPMVFKNGGGKVTTTDICLTPPFGIPIPFTNVASAEDLDNCAEGVFINGHPIAHVKSIFKKTSGDEGGIAGVASGTINSIAKFLRGSPDIFVNSLAVVRHGDLVVSNNNNTPSAPFVQPGMEMPPQLKAKYEAQKKIKPTPDVIDVDATGMQLQCLEELCGFTKEVATTTMIGHKGDEEHSNKVTRRILVRNVAQAKNALALRVPQTEGSGAIDVPLADFKVTPRNSEQEANGPAAGQAKTMLVACTLAWNCTSHLKKLNVKAGDFTDIARFSDTLRAKIYAELATATPDDLKNKPWDQLLKKKETPSAIQHELDKPEFISLNSGWLYIFKDGFLWRELQVNPPSSGQNKYQEVNLLKYAGSNERKATGQAAPQIILPYKVDGTEVKLEMAYSPVQWSWARINYFGGMDPQDPRLLAKQKTTKVQMPSDLPKPKSGSAGSPDTHRVARMVKLDLAPFTKPDAQVDKTTSGASNDPTVILVNHQMLPTIMISDPTGLVNRITNDLLALNVQLKKMLLEISDDPYFHSALMTYQIFFDDSRAINQGKISDADAQDYVNTQDHWWIPKDAGSPTVESVTQPNLLKQAQANLDRTKLEKILRVKERASLRVIIKNLQKASVQMAMATDKDAWYATPLSFTTAYTEFFAASDNNYAVALAGLAGLLNTTCNDPQHSDQNYDVNISSSYIPPGSTLSKAITDKKHIIGSLMLPDNNDEKEFTHLYQTDENYAAHITEENIQKTDSGDGAFNLHKFMATFNGLKGYLPSDASLSMVSSSLTTLIALLTKVEPAEKFKVYDVIRVWLKVTGIHIFFELSVSNGKLVSAEHEVLGYEFETVNTFIKEHSSVDDTDTERPKSGKIKLYAVSADPRDKFLARNVLHLFDGQSVEHNSGASNTKTNLQTISTEAQYRIEFVERIVEPVYSAKKVVYQHTMNTLKTSNKFVAPFLGALQLLNFTAVSNQVAQLKAKQKDSKFNKAIDWIGVIFQDIGYSAYSIEQIYLAFRSKAEVEKLYTDLFKMKSTFVINSRDFFDGNIGSAMPPFAAAGFAASLISFYFAAENLYYDLSQHQSEYISIDSLNMAACALSAASIWLSYAVTGAEVATEILGWVGALCAVVAMVKYKQLNEPKVLKWSTNNPYSIRTPNHDNNPLTFQKLMTVIAEPYITMTRLVDGADQQAKNRFGSGKQGVVVNIALPYFEVYNTELIVQTTWQKQYLNTDMSGLQDLGDAQTAIQPSYIEQVMQGDTIVGMRYYYKDVDVGEMRTVNHSTPVIYYRTRARLQTVDGKVSVPFVTTPISTMVDSYKGINTEEPGWVYAEG